jgi:Flp pilus assembly protein TadG
MFPSRCFRKMKELRSNQSGSSLIEFAASATLMLTAIFGIMDCSRALYADHFVCDGATEAARYAMLRGSTWTGTSCTTPSCMASSSNVTSFVQSIVPFGVSTSSTYLTVITTWPGTTPSGASCSTMGIYNSLGCVVKVNLKYSFNFVLPFLPKNTLVLSSTSAYAISQ